MLSLEHLLLGHPSTIEQFERAQRQRQSTLVNEEQGASHFESLLVLVFEKELPVFESDALILQHDVLCGNEVEVALLAPN